MKLRRELEALKAKRLSGGPDEGPEGLARKIREDAEHANLCAQYGWRPFEIPERGDVLCSVDGKPVTTPSQVWAEPEFWSAMDWAATALVLGLGPSLTYRASDATFVAPSGRLAVSRERHDLRAFEENGGASEAVGGGGSGSWRKTGRPPDSSPTSSPWRRPPTCRTPSCRRTPSGTRGARWAAWAPSSRTPRSGSARGV